jgi:hypothetical protein
MRRLSLFIVSVFLPLLALSQVWVNGYTKSNGTYVAGHYRSSPNSTKADNWSTKGNTNPFTGQPGTKTDNSSNSSYPSYSAPNYSTTPTTTDPENSNSNYTNWDSYRIDEFYSKIDLPYGTLDNKGNVIPYIYKKCDSPKVGKYKVSISEADGDIYEIKGTDYFVTFRSYHGYAGYSEEGVLDDTVQLSV